MREYLPSFPAMRQKFAAVNRHDLSPLPVFVIILAFFYPLDFLSRLQTSFISATRLELYFLFASGFITHAIIAACACLWVYPTAFAISKFSRIPFASATRSLIDLIAWGFFFWALLNALVLLSGTINAWVFEQHRWARFLIPSTAIAGAVGVQFLPVLGAWIRGNAAMQIGTVLGLCLSLVLCPTELILEFRRPTTSLVGGASRSAFPDVVFITLDSLSAKHMSAYGYGRQTTPCIDAFASDSIVFDRFYANSNWTLPTTESILSGERPWTHRAMMPIVRPLPGGIGNGLLESFSNAGYAVLAASMNYAAAPFLHRRHAWMAEESSPFEFRKATLTTTVNTGAYLLPSARFIPQLLLPRAICWADRFTSWLGLCDGISRPDQGIASAQQLWERHSNRSRFLWLHLYQPHAPYVSPPPFLGRFEKSDRAATADECSPAAHFSASKDPHYPDVYLNRYDEYINYTDSQVGRFLEWLKKQGEFDQSLIILSADHGDSFIPQYAGHGGPLLVEDVIHIPLIIKPPSHRTAQRRSVLAEQIDLLPTFCGLAGITPAKLPLGRDLMRTADDDPTPVFSMIDQLDSATAAMQTFSVAMLQGRWKCVLNTHHDIPWPKHELYDLLADPNETNNLTDQQSDVAERMQQEIIRQLLLHGGPVDN